MTQHLNIFMGERERSDVEIIGERRDYGFWVKNMKKIGNFKCFNKFLNEFFSR